MLIIVDHLKCNALTYNLVVNEYVWELCGNKKVSQCDKMREMRQKQLHYIIHLNCKRTYFTR